MLLLLCFVHNVTSHSEYDRWLHLKKFLNIMRVSTEFKTITALDMFISHSADSIMLVLGLESAIKTKGHAVQIWNLYEKKLISSYFFDVLDGEKASSLAIFEHNRFQYIVVGSTFRDGGKELGRVRLLKFDETNDVLESPWEVSSTTDQKMFHLNVSAIKILQVSSLYPEDEGLPVKMDLEKPGFVARNLKREMAIVPDSPWVIIGYKDKTFSIFCLDGVSDSLVSIYSWTGSVKSVAHTDLILALTAFQSGTDITIITGSWDKTVRFWHFQWTRGNQLSGWKLVPIKKSTTGGEVTGSGVNIYRVHKKSVTAMASHTFSVPETMYMDTTGVATHQISKVLVTGSLDTSVIVWDLESGEIIRKLQGHTDQINCVKIYDTHMDGLPPLVITSGKDKQLILWNLITGDKVRVIALTVDMPTFSVVQTDNKGLMIVGACGSDVQIYNFDAVERIRRLETDAVTAIDIFYPRPNEVNPLLQQPLVVIGAIDGTCSVFNYYTGREQKAMKIARCLESLPTSPGSKEEALEARRAFSSGSRRNLPFKSNPQSNVGSTEEDAPDHNPNGHTDRINSAIIYTPAVVKQFTETASAEPACDVLVITTSSDNHVKVWQIDGNFVKDLGKHSVTVYPLTMYDPQIYTADPQMAQAIADAGDRFLRDTWVITGDRAGEIKVWSLFSTSSSKRSTRNEGSSMVVQFKAHGAMVRALVVHYPRDDVSNPLLVSGAYDKTATIWLLSTQQPLYTIKNVHTGFIFALAIYNPYDQFGSPGVTMPAVLVTGSYDNTAITWSLSNILRDVGSSSLASSSNKAAYQLQTLAGHSESVTDLAIYTPRLTSDRPLVLTCSIDKLIVVWDLHAGTRLQILVGHTDRVCFMTIFQPPARRASTGTSSGIAASHPLDFPTVISGGDDKMNIIWEDSLYQQRMMPTREMVNRAFAFDLQDDDWPLITALAVDYEGRIFYENSHLFYLAIRHKRPDFLLKFRRYLARVLTYMRQYDADCFHGQDDDDSDDSGLEALNARTISAPRLFGSTASREAAYVSADPVALPDLVGGDGDGGPRKKNFFLSIYSDLLVKIPGRMLQLPRELLSYVSPPTVFPPTANAATTSSMDSTTSRQGNPDDSRGQSNVRGSNNSGSGSSSGRSRKHNQTSSGSGGLRMGRLNSVRSLTYADSTNISERNKLTARPKLQRAKTSLEILESQPKKNILLYAIEKNDLVSLRAILLCWTEILNTDIDDLLAQRLYHPLYYFPETDLSVLAQVYPLEFMHFITSLRLIRNVPSLLHQERARLDETTRFEIAGAQSRCARSDLIWGSHIHAQASSSSSASSSDSWILSIFEDNFSGTTISKAQPITSMILPLKMPRDIRDLMDLFVYVTEQLGTVEIFDSDLAVFTLRYLWTANGRSTHVLFSCGYLVFLLLFNLNVYTYEVYYNAHSHLILGACCAHAIVWSTMALFVYSIYCVLFTTLSTSMSSNGLHNRHHTEQRRSLLTSALVLFCVVLVKLCAYHYFFDEVAYLCGLVAINLLNGLIVLGFCCYGLEEFAQAFEKFKDLSVDTLLLHFVFDVWNLLDLSIVLTGIAGQSLRMVYQRDTAVGRCLLAATSVTMWFKLLYYLRPFSRSGPLVVMIITIASEIRILLIVLFFVLCGFTQALWLISNINTENHFGTVEKAFYNAFLYMLGQNIETEFAGTVSQRFGKFLLIMFLSVMVILLLNLLVALMGDTFSSVRAQGVARWRKEQASIILENRFSLDDFIPSEDILERLLPPALLDMRLSREQNRQRTSNPPHWTTRVSRQLLPETVRRFLWPPEDPPYLHVLKYAAEVHVQRRIGFRKLRRLVRRSRRQVRAFSRFRLVGEEAEDSEDDGADDLDEDEEDL